MFPYTQQLRTVPPLLSHIPGTYQKHGRHAAVSVPS